MYPDIVKSPPYDRLRDLYNQYFSLGHINSDINRKFALISLVCYVTYKAKAKKPDVTHYSILMNITKDNTFPEDFIKGLAVVCEDFSYGCTEFPTFNLKGNDIITTIKDILNSYVPF